MYKYKHNSTYNSTSQNYINQLKTIYINTKKTRKKYVLTQTNITYYKMTLKRISVQNKTT